MSHFRKKSVVIEAEQFNAEAEAWPDGVFVFKGRTGIYTMDGFRHVNDYDWIITNPDGDKCVCKADAFEQTYETVPEVV